MCYNNNQLQQLIIYHLLFCLKSVLSRSQSIHLLMLRSVRAVRSVSVNSALPGVEHLLVVVLLGLDASLVLQLCKFSRALLVHNFLKFASHGAVALTDLTQDVGLVHLLHHRSLNHLLFVGLVLTLNFCLHILALKLFHPLGFFFLFFLKFNILLTVSVDILKKIDTGLILTVPLLFTSLPLFSVFCCNKLINHLFVGLFV